MNKALRFLISSSLLLILAPLISGCNDSPATGPDSAQTDSQAPQKPQGRLFGASFQTLNNPFFVDLGEGLQKELEANGDELIILDAQFNSLKQKNDLSDLILKDVAGIFVNPVNWEGLKGSLLEAQRKKVPIIIVDAPVKKADEELIVCTVASDNVRAGKLAAEALAKVNPKAKLVVLHLSVNKACIDRVAGFKEAMQAYPDMEILDVQEAKGTTEGARPVMRDLIGRYPDLNAVFAINDPNALGVISALDSANKLDKVTIVTVDGSQAGIKAIQAGKLHSTSAQFPKEIGKIAAEKMLAHLKGEPVDKDVKVRVELITAENAEQHLEAN
ncbi:D-ribose-binding periplasmic protein precursor [Gimesia panareensis]|uniref:D-ribose-binding periplasmic protein n=1 Tax=Gimesia panareensis TaxID=2527978 RepID=A0A518FYR8_9PLAN|nr:sugar ABC transporter substrate-binding protein [Gimesia panareensis]QDV21517.1 D-ribose-binding periplasmic protein precursor [Gimesia panareensis]